MNIIEAIVLGIVQGIAEFLPISSSGHLLVIPSLFGWEPMGIEFDTIMHLATFLAVVFVFKKDILEIAKAMTRKEKSPHKKLGWMIVIATIPVVAAGLLLEDTIDATIRTPFVVAISLIFWGVVLLLADIRSKHVAKKTKSEENLSWRQSITIGLTQTLALIPGTSRSGITMTAGLFQNLDRKTTARFSFLLSIPAVGGAAAYVILKAILANHNLFTPELIVGFIASFISGILAIKVLLKVLEKYSFTPFAIYRIVFGIVILLFFT